MLYKVTPMMPPPEAANPKKAREPGQPRKKRKSAIYDAEGNEVLITLMCLKCKSMKPLAQFGLRKMADGAIRNQPWCRGCRGAAGTKKKADAVQPETSSEVQVATVAVAPAVEAKAVEVETVVVPLVADAGTEASAPVEFDLLPDPVI